MFLRLRFAVQTFHNGIRLFFKRSKSNDSPNKMYNKEEPRSAGILVIGDEVLKGQVHDTNSHFIVKKMYKLGVKVHKVTVVGDVEDVIAAEIKSFSEKYTYVITTGGIGPTHDDITFESVAKAFSEPLIPHPELVKLITDYYKTEDLNSAPMKMAHIPRSAKLTYGFDEINRRRVAFPIISIRNVYMFPGIPELMEKLFVILSKDLFGGGSRQFFKKDLYLNASEADIAKVLNTSVAEFPEVTFGSYPKLLHSYYKVHITVESESEDITNKAYNRLKETLQEVVVQYDDSPLERADEKLLKILNMSNNPAYKGAVDTIEDCLQKYSPEEICIYFDGSNEAVCVLHIYYALMLQKKSLPILQAISIKEFKRKKELERFINESVSRYNMHFEILENQCQRSSSFTAMSNKQSCIKAIIVGNVIDEIQQTMDWQKIFQDNTSYSDIKWITPLINWKSEDVQKFIQSLTLPCCAVCDKGYELLGTTDVLLNTIEEMNKRNK